jgi:hypothetical protein
MLWMQKLGKLSYITQLIYNALVAIKLSKISYNCSVNNVH